jgi:ankyrin repeat protein
VASAFRRTLPDRPDLDQQRTLAKELRRAFAAGDPEAIARIRTALPDKRRITLADAQHTLAREYGFAGWDALAHHIRSLAAEVAPLEERLRDAFHRCDVRTLRRLFGEHPELRGRLNEPVFGFDAPAIVAYSGNLAMVEMLLELGADPNKRSEWWAGGFHALHGATQATADRIIAAGADPDACAAAHLDRPDLLARLLAEDPARVHERGGDGQTPLHFARSRAVCDLLLDAGADIDARDVDHRATPAQWMLDRKRGAGRYELAAYLVKRGATSDIFLSAALGLTSRAAAMVTSDASLLDLRTGQGSYGEQPPSSHHIYFWTLGAGLSPLDVAEQFEERETLEALLALASPVQRLLFAACRGDDTRAHALARKHPGIVASLPAKAHRALADAAWRGDAAAVGLMIELGFDPRVTGHDTGSALHLAAWQGSAASIAAILRHPAAGELIATRDARHGSTPLGWCCHGSVHGNRAGAHAEVARLLLTSGADPSTDTAECSAAVRRVLAAAQRRGAE